MNAGTKSPEHTGGAGVADGGSTFPWSVPSAGRREHGRGRRRRPGSLAGVTFATAGSIGALPGRRDDLLAILVRSKPELSGAGCLLYEVGVDDEDPDAVFVVELWESPEAHQASLGLDSVRAAIDEARPLLSGRFTSTRFTVAGSPLR